jgi:outer membrane protein assembly factor BamB
VNEKRKKKEERREGQEEGRRRPPFRFFLASFLFSLFFPLSVRADDWPRWRGPEGNGVSREADWRPQALAPAPKVLWKTLVGEGHSSLLVAGGRLYTMGNQGGKDVVQCLDAEKGRRLWSYGYACPAGNFNGTRATPALDGGLLYTLSRNGHAFCFEADSGKARWQKNLVSDFGAKNTDYGITGTPLVCGDAVVYNAGASGLALHKATGEKLWASAAGLPGFASPVPFRQQARECVALFGATELCVLDVKTGERLGAVAWRTPFDANSADPLFFDGKLFITSAWERGCALLDVSGSGVRTVWENKNFRGHFASPVYWDGFIYGIDSNTPNGELRCLDAASGQMKWTQKGGFENLIVAGGRILAIDRRGVLTVAEASPAGYKEIARAAVLSSRAKNWTAPVLANGLLYCRNGDGELVCLDVR